MGVIKLCIGWMVISLFFYNDDDFFKRNENVRYFRLIFEFFLYYFLV